MRLTDRSMLRVANDVRAADLLAADIDRRRRQVGHRRRELDERLHAAKGLGQREQAGRFGNRHGPVRRGPVVRATGRRDERDHPADARVANRRHVRP